ncbi:MAG: hypothetical protein EON61_06170 [Alphaproteobacteria bacterium]|nr:MAG: hypothetical protein EON61_06170 [Alphaproteobacteria bacterium]
MDGKLRTDSLVAGIFPWFRAFPVGPLARKRRQVREFFHFLWLLRAEAAGNFRSRRREFGTASQGISAGPAAVAGAKNYGMKNRIGSSSDSPAGATAAGYGHPPVTSRWKAGQSGNPQGRLPHTPVHPEHSASEPEIQPKVGYRQPPRHSRWKPGQSGNPGGGPRRDILEAVLLSPFPVKIRSEDEDGRRVRRDVAPHQDESIGGGPEGGPQPH